MSHNQVSTAEVQEREGARRGAMALEHTRERASQELLERRSFDIADIPGEQFHAGLERIKLRQLRLRQIIETALISGAHFGNPKGAFPRDILFKAGAEELRSLFRLTPKILTEDVQQSPEFVSVTLTVGLLDPVGRITAAHTANCNSRERRFKKFDKTGWTYEDPREVLDNCYAMALKRASNRATLEATGASAFFAAEDEMEAGLAAREGNAPEPWTDEERKKFKDDAIAAGIKTRADLERFVIDALSAERAVLRTDVPKLYEALEARKTAAARPAASEAASSGTSATDAPPAKGVGG